jgi:hypothetical protein
MMPQFEEMRLDHNTGPPFVGELPRSVCRVSFTSRSPRRLLGMGWARRSTRGAESRRGDGARIVYAIAATVAISF